MSAKVLCTMSEGRFPRGPPLGQDVERARRALFVDPPQNCNQAAQARQVAAEELADSIRQKSAQWNFDFNRGKPLENSESRLIWQRPEKTERIPEAYALQRLPFLSSHAASDESGAESPSSSDESSVRRSRQSSITDFMPKRKSAAGAGSSKASSTVVKAAAAAAGSDNNDSEQAATAANSPPPCKKQKISSSTSLST